MSKRYNSVFDLGFSIDHDNEDASDLTADDFYDAVKRRIAETLPWCIEEWFNAVGEPYDTEDREEVNT